MHIFIDIDKLREVEDLRVEYHTTPDEHGVDKEYKFAAFMVIGVHRRWENWIPYDVFRRLNAGMEI